MSGSRRSNQGPRYDWVPPEAQHTPYGNQGGIDQITAGISGVSLHNSPYGHGSGYDNVPPYAPDAQYYPQNSYYPQDPSYAPQEGGYSQVTTYPSEPQYTQTTTGQYRGDGYDFQPIDNSVDQNAQYTTDPRQQYSSHGPQHKGKSRVVDQATTSKPRGSKEKTRESHKDYGKGKSSASKSGRSKSGKAHTEEDELAQDEADVPGPFYGRNMYAQSEQKSANLDHAPQDEITTANASADDSGYDDTYSNTSQTASDQVLDHEGHGVSQVYGDPYATGHEYQGSHSSGSRQPMKEDMQANYLPTLSDPYPPELPDDFDTAVAESSGYEVGGSSHMGEDDSGIGTADFTYSGHEDGAGIQTPRAATPQATIASTVGQAELDARFVVELSSRFAVGEVFKVLWSEPLGSGRGDMTDAETRSHLGQRFYVGIRRFIIVRTDEGHSTCVPILTYERRACTKRGVKPRTHGIIYPEGSRPRLLEGEPQLGCRPVKIELDYPSERIVKESRVNYSKLVTVEHNVRVFFIGRVSAGDFHLVNESVDKCWEYKNKLSKGDSRKHYPNYRTHR